MITVEILTMKLSEGREHHYVCVENDGRRMEVAMYKSPYYNRALYERDMLRWVLLGEPKPDLMAEEYADPPLTNQEGSLICQSSTGHQGLVTSGRSTRPACR